MIGQHAMAGTERGNLNHTQCSTSIEYYKLNGKPIGELAQWALCAGAYDVPLIFVSGDEATGVEARDLIPGICTATVKVGLSRTSAISCSIAESYRRIREGLKQALQQHRKTPIIPLRWESPFILEKRYFHSGIVDGYASNPRAKIVDPLTVQLHSNNILDIIYA
jgi:D-amino peptidase